MTAPARDYFTSNVFCVACVWAEGRYEQWRILSPMHGVVGPRYHVAHANYDLLTQGDAAIDAWAEKVVRDTAGISPGNTVDVIAPQRIVTAMNEQAKRLKIGVEFRAPFAGLRAGEQCRAMGEQIDAVTDTDYAGETNHAEEKDRTSQKAANKPA